MGKRTSEQAPMWIPAADLPVSPGHPFYARLNAILDEAGFDRFAEEQCRSFYAPRWGARACRRGGAFGCCCSAISRASNILKRLLIHAGAFNLGLLTRQAFGLGTPRGLQGRGLAPAWLEIALGTLADRVWGAATRLWRASRPIPPVLPAAWTAARAC